MKSPFEKKFCGKSPLKELTAKQEANLPEALKTAIEASPNNYGSPLEQSFGESNQSVMNEKSEKDIYQDSIQKLHKPAHDAYVKRSKSGFYVDDTDGGGPKTYVAPRKPENIKSLKDFSYAKEIAKGGSVTKNGVAASKLARMYK